MFKNYLYRLAKWFITKKWTDHFSALKFSEITKRAVLESLLVLEKAPTSFIREVQYRNCYTLLNTIATLNRFWGNYLSDNNLRAESFNRIDDLKNLPVTDKIFYRKKSDNDYLVSSYKNIAEQYFTSGSSGMPFFFFTDNISSFWRYALTLRGNGWAGYLPKDRFLRVIYPSGRSDPMHSFAKESAAYFSWDDNPERAAELAKELKDKKRAAVVYGSLEFFRTLEKSDIVSPPFNIRSLVVTGEPVGKTERLRLEKFFETNIFVSYATREFGRVAQECENKDGYHVNAERFVIEIVDDYENPLPDGSTGRILITDTKNFVMPFLRFDIGDSGYLVNAPCSCGRTLPKLFVESRSTDRIELVSGERLPAYMLYRVFKNKVASVLRYQIVQHDKTDFLLLISTLPAYSPKDEEDIRMAFKDVIGDKMKLKVQLTDKNFIIKNGKLLPFISLIDRNSNFSH